MTDDRIRIRIDSEAKARAVEIAEQQGITLSDAIRALLALWVEGHLDVGELVNGPTLPTEAELQELGGALDQLQAGIDTGRDAIERFASRHRRALGMKAAIPHNGLFDFDLSAEWWGR